MSFWTNLRRFFFGWEKCSTLEDFILQTSSVEDMISYAKQNFYYEPDINPQDEWQEPHHAFLALQSFGTPSDCEDFAVVFDEWFKAKGYESNLLVVWNDKTGHAVCTYKVGQWIYYVDNFFRPRWRFSTVQQICVDIYQNCKTAKYAAWDNQKNKYTYMENINLKV